MKLRRDLSGHELVNMLCRHCGYQVVHQKGRHIVLQTEQPSRQRIAVPAHKTLRIGTLNAILRLVARHKRVERDELVRLL